MRLTLGISPRFLAHAAALAACGLLANTVNAQDVNATQPLGGLTEDTLKATVEACTKNLVFNPDITPAATVLGLIGWEPLSTDDQDWYLAIETQSNAAWTAYSRAAETKEQASILWKGAYEYSANSVDADVRAGNVFRGEGDSLLRLLPDAKECVLLSGPSDAANDLYRSLSDPIETTLTSSILRARSTGAATQVGGVYEGNVLQTEGLSTLFNVDFTLSYVFLILAGPDQ